MRFSSSDAAGQRGIPGLGPGVSPASVTGLLKEMAGSSEFALRQRLGRIQPLQNWAARYSPREGKVNSEWGMKFRWKPVLEALPPDVRKASRFPGKIS
jgi:hypothetical protein